MLNILSSCLGVDPEFDHVHNLDDGLVQEPAFTSLAADALSKDKVGNNVRDKCSETSVS